MVSKDKLLKIIRPSLEGHLTFVSLVMMIVSSGLASWLAQKITPWWLAWFIVLTPSIALLTYWLHRTINPINQLIAAMSNGIASFSDTDFSVSVAVDRYDELGELARAQNALGDVLRRERQSLYQRELLLDTVIQSAPTSMVLSDQRGRIVYSNMAARHLLAQGKGINGEQLSSLGNNLPPGLQQALVEENNGLFTVENDEQLTYHISVNRFTLNTQIHKLYLIKHLTHEINRQEVSIWKKVIRLISHELNNSLAPISSLAHSGQLIGESIDQKQIKDIFFTIKDRAEHLKTFIEGYARFARLPLPQPEPVDVKDFVTSLQSLHTFSIDGILPNTVVHFDLGQLQQALINLLKNAHESGSSAEEISVAVKEDQSSLVFFVRDRGKGMSESLLKNALLPFYSTKTSGSGLGLPLCREIVEAHGGYLKLYNRDLNGLEAIIALPKNDHSSGSAH